MEQAASFSYFYGKVHYKYTCYVLHTVNTVEWKDSPVEPRSSSIFFFHGYMSCTQDQAVCAY